jgi:hypothetical protein
MGAVAIPADAELGNYTTCLSDPYHSMCQLDMAATATITDMPEGAFVETITNGDITANTVSLTTDENGQETAVPILACPPPMCELIGGGVAAGVVGGGIAAALALKKFPPTPNRQYKLSGIPPFRVGHLISIRNTC